VQVFQPSDPDYEKRVRASFARQGIMTTLGASLIRLVPGEAEIEFSYSPALTQHNGYIHAGVITTVVDSACGYAAYTLMPAESDVLSIEYKVNFMSPAMGETFRGVGRVVKAGRTVTVCSGDVIAVANGVEKVVATMLATMITMGRQPER
jgi:uncharacterized protein (TIGR00369 family)